MIGKPTYTQYAQKNKKIATIVIYTMFLWNNITLIIKADFNLYKRTFLDTRMIS